MKKYKITRNSVCNICGKRLSEKTGSGTIRWHPSLVDDAGIYCETCRPPGKTPPGRKGSRA